MPPVLRQRTMLMMKVENGYTWLSRRHGDGNQHPAIGGPDWGATRDNELDGHRLDAGHGHRFTAQTATCSRSASGRNGSLVSRTATVTVDTKGPSISDISPGHNTRTRGGTIRFSATVTDSGSGLGADADAVAEMTTLTVGNGGGPCYGDQAGRRCVDGVGGRDPGAGKLLVGYHRRGRLGQCGDE